MKGNKLYYAAAIILALLLAAIYYWSNRNRVELIVPEQSMVACTMDAKICADGSAVGRQGPNCEFTPCPGE